MGNALIMRRGGADALNFRVYIGPDEPAQAKENTIWIDTDVDVPHWVLSERNPYLAYRDVDMLSGVTPVSGYFSSSGAVSAADATKQEVHTEEYFPVTFGKVYRYEQGMTAEYSQWLAICEYTSDRTFIGRTVLVNSVTGVLAEGTYTPSKSTVAYVRLSWRTYGDIGAGARLIEPDVPYTPESVEYGTVWIQTAKNGSASLNALRRNALMLNPADVQSLIGLDLFGSGERTWMKLPGYVYQNGEWIPIRTLMLTLYDAGNTCSEVTGGWAKTGGTLTFNTDHMLLMGSGVVLFTVNMISLRNYSTLRFSVIASSTESVTTVGVGTGTAAGEFVSSRAVPQGSADYTDVDVDVSGLVGTYYVKVQTYASKVGCCVRSVMLL